ncbi:MAG: hypothetical protein IK125_05815 [Lachnospiraceae bacterium]|nr:hypothetical protein [Lachnospiraceae bacterium]
MEELLKCIKARITTLKKAIAKAERETGSFPDGRLRVSRSGKHVRYFQMLKQSDTVGEYIKKEKVALAGQLAQKDYLKHFLKDAYVELNRLEKLYAQLSKENADLTYDKLSAERKGLVVPYIATKEQVAESWMAKTFRTNPYLPEAKIYDTRRGEKVRSKSEAILADMFYDLGIPYRYEEQVQLRSGKKAYPDFTLLNTKTREEVYFEHFGLLDDADYRGEALRKLEEYRRSGIFSGRNLMFSYETEDTPLDIKGIREMLKTMFK